MNPEERMIVTIEARVAEFERAIEERFKPALQKAIADVAVEFLEGLSEDEFATFRVVGE